MMSESLLLMIVSTAIAVLPVWRSPMMSSRWPRPIGISPSIAFRPVCIGSVTGWGRLARDARAGLELPGRHLRRLDVALAIERAAERVHDAAEAVLRSRDAEKVA